MSKKLVIIGDIAYETIIIGGKEYKSIGGSGYYSAIGALAAKNKDFKLVSNVGYDFNLNDLKQLNINTDFINKVESATTARFLTEYKNKTRLFSCDDYILNYSNYSIINRLIKANIIYFSGSNPKRQLAWIHKLKEKNYNGTIASDIFDLYCKRYPKETMEVISNSDVVFMNNEEMNIICYSLYGEQTAIIKNGGNGASFINKKRCFSVYPDKQVKAIDTNGAGDILAGVYLSNLLSNKNALDSLQNAVNIATNSVIKKGVLHII